jgi:hypothetical protein
MKEAVNVMELIRCPYEVLPKNKLLLGENADYEQEIDYYKKSYHDIYNLDFSGEKYVCCSSSFC